MTALADFPVTSTDPRTCSEPVGPGSSPAAVSGAVLAADRSGAVPDQAKTMLSWPLLVHGQDIAVPLGRSLHVPPDLAVVAADRVWSSSRMFHARRKLTGYRLAADDAPWAAGRGREVHGPIGALLLLLTGRPAALSQLSGPGAEGLRVLLRPPSASAS